MILENKKILIMGIRNKWSIAWGAALSAYENGAEIIFTYNYVDGGDKLQRLIEEIPGAKAYACDASSDESIKECFEAILKEHGKVDGILHAIAHANTDDLRNDFIKTSRDGFAHASDVSAYSLVAVARIAKELKKMNLIDEIIKEPENGAQEDFENVCQNLKNMLLKNIKKLSKIPQEDLITQRYEKYRKIGGIL